MHALVTRASHKRAQQGRSVPIRNPRVCMSLSSLRLIGLASVTAVVMFATAASALAAPARGLKSNQSTLSSAATTARFCATRSVTGQGIATRRYVAPADGYLTARLSGGSERSDWDLAIVDAKTGKALDGSAGLASYEVATTAVLKGQVLRVQACRHKGAARSVALSTQLARVDFSGLAKALKGQKVVLARVKLKGAADAARLRKLGLDLADDAVGNHWDVQLYSDAQQAQLRDAGFEFTVREADVLAKARRDRASERRAAARAARNRPRGRAAQAFNDRTTPNNRTSYRSLPEIQQGLRDLAAANSDIAKLVVLPRRSIEGREIMGIEIAERVNDPEDGRPTFVNLGNHHAREWPSAEAPMEWAYELIRRYRAGEARWTNVVRNARTVVIPVVNVDGFSATINAERNNLSDPAEDQGAGFEQALGIGAYKRKNCSTGDPVTERQPCILRTRPAAGPGEEIPPFSGAQLVYRDLGVDLNRNYGEQWGGPGTEHTRTGTFPPDASGFGITFHGPSAFSEPEVQAVREWSRTRNISVLIGNHTYSGLILRPPGTSVDGPAEDESRLRALGDAMAVQTDYVSQYGYQLYDTTGTLDDYIYGGLGAFAYTPEIGKVNFHPNYVQQFIPEYAGRQIEDPDTGAPTGQYRGGLREAYLLAAEAAADAGSHSVLRGTAPAGRVLKLSRTVVSNPSTRPDDNGVNDGPDVPITEPRTISMTVPSSGEFAWHIPPSRQPGKREGTAAAPWQLTCEDGAGNVLERRDIAIERSQSFAVGLACGQPAPPAGGGETCTDPNGFRSVSVKRVGKSLRISFSKKTRNAVNVEIFQTSKGRRIVNNKRVARFRNRQRSFTWNGRKTSGRKARVARGVYFVRFRVTDDARKVDTRRVVVAKRANGRFYKRGKYVLENTCP
jgi:hypothetical protein